jgi:hypothetical protein
MNWACLRHFPRPDTRAAFVAGTPRAGLEIVAEGASRNWLFAASHLLYQFLPASRQKYIARAHWAGRSACLTARRPL